MDEALLEPLLQGSAAGRWLDPQAVGRVEARLRRRSLEPRTAEEMAESLRELGDLTPTELFGPMEAQLRMLEDQGRAVAIMLHGTPLPKRWILTEEQDLYRRAFEPETSHEPDAAAIETIVRRYLRTHALIGLAELMRRYPIAPELATELLERWVESGGVIRLAPADDESEPRWAERDNLADIQRLSVAIRRRESVAVIPEVFADFLVRRQGLHPTAQLDGTAAVEKVLDQLRGFAATASFWESEILPRRVRHYRPAWLDELLATGSWLWRAARDGRDEPLVALVPRDFAGDWPFCFDAGSAGDDETTVLEAIGRRGASFAADLARFTGLEPTRLRGALQQLLSRGLTTNDRFDPLRPGALETLNALVEAGASRSAGFPRVRPRRSNPGRPEGRWSLLEAPAGDEESQRLAWMAALLDRYGIVTRELVELDPWAPSWADLAPWLARAELRGELRRGYFVEGFSGVQYATQEAADELARLAGSAIPASEDILLAAADPANLYGSGAPLDIPLLDGGTARLSQIAGNYLVLRGGRPVLVIEAHGKRLTGLASASKTEIDSALTRLLELAPGRRQVLKVETYNGEPAISSPAASRLAELEFVRDYPGMTFYAAWASG